MLYDKYRTIVNLVGRAVEQGLDLCLDAVDASRGALLPLAELAGEFGYDANYLGRLARASALGATKRGGRWYARRQDILDYKARVATETRGLRRA